MRMMLISDVIFLFEMAAEQPVSLPTVDAVAPAPTQNLVQGNAAHGTDADNEENETSQSGQSHPVNQIMDSDVSGKGQKTNAIITTAGDVGATLATACGFPEVGAVIGLGSQAAELLVDLADPSSPPPLDNNTPTAIAPVEQASSQLNVNSGMNANADSIETSNAPIYQV